MLAVTHIHQVTQADEMEWPVGKLIVEANKQEVHSLLIRLSHTSTRLVGRVRQHKTRPRCQAGEARR